MSGKSQKVDFRVMSNLTCRVATCGKRIKENVARRKQSTDLLCYNCFRIISKSTIRTARECRRDHTRKADRIV
jgi:hypothetical protein